VNAVLSYLLLASAITIAVPVAVFCIEVTASIVIKSGGAVAMPPRLDRRIAVLVPAHNESAGLLPTLADIRAQLRVGDTLLVVADNCTDDTAAVAAAAGAEVIERHDPARLGKGYALDFGVRHLGIEPPEIMIIIDADCRLGNNTINRLLATCVATQRPVQALYLMTAPASAQVNQLVAEFAWRVKNWLRPLGLMKLHLPCQLMGTGMAFPWEVICSASLANGFVVEDLKLGLDLTLKGHPPLFCPSALVTSEFASSASGARSQRERWERGHISMIASAVPQLLSSALAHRNWSLLALTLDLLVPPLSLLAILVIGIVAMAALWAFFGFSSSALTMSAACLATFVLAAFLAWLNHGRDLVPIGAILSIPFYILGKLGLYRIKLFNKTAAQWTRTDRTKSH
jgi:cellulose synthase/poly-beta-1,6-N-acetylglucosamine synthase-like glycosyltransferase